MKFLLASAAMIAAPSLAAPASAQAWVGINARQANLEQRIDQGVRNGSLTRAEAARLRSEFRALANLEAQYRRTGGGLNNWERNDLNVRFDRLSGRIHVQRNDNQDRYGANWQSINQRQANLDQRIDQGVRSGQLSRREAIRLRSEFNQIAALEAQYRRSGGGLSIAERHDLDRRFDRLSVQIRDERRDGDNRRY